MPNRVVKPPKAEQALPDSLALNLSTVHETVHGQFHHQAKQLLRRYSHQHLLMLVSGDPASSLGTNLALVPYVSLVVIGLGS